MKEIPPYSNDWLRTSPFSRKSSIAERTSPTPSARRRTTSATPSASDLGQLEYFPPRTPHKDGSALNCADAVTVARSVSPSDSADTSSSSIKLWVSEMLSGPRDFQVDAWSVPRASRSSGKSKTALAQILGSQVNECELQCGRTHFGASVSRRSSPKSMEALRPSIQPVSAAGIRR